MYETDMERSARSSEVANVHLATMPPAQEHNVRNWVANPDPGRPPVRLERHQKVAERVKERAGLDPQLCVTDRLVALAAGLENRDASPIVTGGVFCPGGLATAAGGGGDGTHR